VVMASSCSSSPGTVPGTVVVVVIVVMAMLLLLRNMPEPGVVVVVVVVVLMTMIVVMMVMRLMAALMEVGMMRISTVIEAGVGQKSNHMGNIAVVFFEHLQSVLLSLKSHPFQLCHLRCIL